MYNIYVYICIYTILYDKTEYEHITVEEAKDCSRPGQLHPYRREAWQHSVQRLGLIRCHLHLILTGASSQVGLKNCPQSHSSPCEACRCEAEGAAGKRRRVLQVCSLWLHANATVVTSWRRNPCTWVLVWLSFRTRLHLLFDSSKQHHSTQVSSGLRFIQDIVLIM